MWSLQYLWISRCKFHRPSTHPFIHPSTHPWIHPFLHICYTYVSHMHIYIYTFAQPVHEYSYMSNSPHCSKHAFTFHSPFVPRSCPRHFCCRSLILDTCTKPSAVAPSSRVTVTKAPKGAVRATTPVNHSWHRWIWENHGKSWKILKRPWHQIRWKHEELPNQWVNKNPGTIFELLALWKHAWDAWATGWRRDEVPWSAMKCHVPELTWDFPGKWWSEWWKWWTNWDLPRASDETWWTRMNQVETSQ